MITAAAMPVPTLISTRSTAALAAQPPRWWDSFCTDSAKRQVLCVTHLPQVAACGDNHWRVEKQFTGETTRSSLRVLTARERVEEVARMLAGISISDNTRAVAQEMLRGGGHES